MFYFKIIFIITNKYNTTFIPFLYIHYMCACTKKNHVVIKYVYSQIVLCKNRNKKSSRYHCCSNV